MRSAKTLYRKLHNKGGELSRLTDLHPDELLAYLLACDQQAARNLRRYLIERPHLLKLEDEHLISILAQVEGVGVATATRYVLLGVWAANETGAAA